MSEQLLYIAGWGRSGSTLLERVLGRIDGVVPAGEIREVWERGLVENRLCGCGEQFLSCPFWRKVGESAFGGWENIDAERVRELRRRVDRPWTALALFLPHRMWPHRRDADEFLELLRNLYTAISTVAGARIVVDSSKIPTYALLLRAAAMRPRVLHLVRDARGVVFSWQKTVVRPDGPAADTDLMLRYGTVGACVRYVVYNALAHVLGMLGMPYLRLRYEDVVAAPAAGMARAAEFAGERLGDDLAGELRGQVVVLEPDHSVDGNPMRFQTGTVTIRPDARWNRELPVRTRMAVTVLTAPLLTRYGYLSRRGAS